MTREEIKDFCDMKAQLEPENEDIFKAIIKELEQEPVIHAKWERGYLFPDGEYWKCSHCNELIKVKIPMHYCNNCGAKMDKE